MENKETLGKLFQAGIMIPLLSVFAIASVYYHEAGYFQRMGIPINLIQIELARNINLVFAFTAFASSLITTIASLSVFVRKIKTDQWLWKIIFSMLAACGIYTMCTTLKAVFITSNWPLFTTIAMAAIFLAGSYINAGKNKSDLLDFYDVIYHEKATYLWIGLIITAFLCLVFFQIGFQEANEQKEFFVKSDKKTLLIRKYTDYDILGVTDSIGAPFKQFILVYGKGQSDTFITIK